VIAERFTERAERFILDGKRISTDEELNLTRPTPSEQHARYRSALRCRAKLARASVDAVEAKNVSAPPGGSWSR